MSTEAKNIFSDVKKVHLIGAGGAGMSGIAEYLALKRFEVTGSDISKSPVTLRLGKLGVKMHEGHSEENLPSDCGLVIYTSAAAEDNPELAKARRLGIKTVKRAEALGAIVNDMYLIAVSGTHGKTTTTAMIAKALIDAKADPTVFIGGSAEFLSGATSRIGKSNIAVVEADEFDRSYLQLTPDILVITNIDEDHLDIYKDIEDIKQTFGKLIKKCKKDSVVIACGDEKNVMDVTGELSCKVTYGFRAGNVFRIEDVSFDKGSISFHVKDNEIRIKVPGRHNILNATAAYAVMKQLKISDERFDESMRSFFGVKRRLELKYENGFRVYDDYAHHPAEVKASLDALAKANPSRLITVFQPHLYSRTKDFYREFADAFAGTDILLLAKVYPAREKPVKGVTSELILNEYNKAVAEKSKKSGGMRMEGFYIEDNEKILNLLETIAVDGDVIVFQGAGDITSLCDAFIKRIRRKSGRAVPL